MSFSVRNLDLPGRNGRRDRTLSRPQGTTPTARERSADRRQPTCHGLAPERRPDARQSDSRTETSQPEIRRSTPCTADRPASRGLTALPFRDGVIRWTFQLPPTHVSPHSRFAVLSDRLASTSHEAEREPESDRERYVVRETCCGHRGCSNSRRYGCGRRRHRWCDTPRRRLNLMGSAAEGANTRIASTGR